MVNLLLALLLAQPAAVRTGTPGVRDPALVVVAKTNNPDAGTPLVQVITNNPDGGIQLTEQTVWENPDSECERTGKYRGRDCFLWDLRGRRTLGWASTTDFAEVAGHLDTSQSNSLDTSTATTYYLHSTSALDVDVDGGSGARTVRIFYLLDGGIPATTTRPLNGTTAVSIGSGYAVFQWMNVTDLGSANTTGATVGDITIDTSAAGLPTVAQTIDIITAGNGRSSKGRFVVPSTHTCYGLDWSCTATGGGATQDTQLRSNVDPYDRTIQDGVRIEQESSFLSNNSPVNEDLHYLRFPPSSVMRLVSRPSATAAVNRLDVNAHLMCIKN